MTPGVRVHVVMPPSLVEGVDAARAEGQSRGDWVRRAVERALDAPVATALVDAPAPAEQPEIQGLRNFAESMSKSTVARAEEVTGRVSPPKPIPPRVPFRRDVKPFQRGDK